MQSAFQNGAASHILNQTAHLYIHGILQREFKLPPFFRGGGGIKHKQTSNHQKGNNRRYGYAAGFISAKCAVLISGHCKFLFASLARNRCMMTLQYSRLVSTQSVFFRHNIFPLFTSPIKQGNYTDRKKTIHKTAEDKHTRARTHTKDIQK